MKPMKDSTARAWGWFALGCSVGMIGFDDVPWWASLLIAICGALLVLSSVRGDRSMTDTDFRFLCTLFMVSDPWPQRPLSRKEHDAIQSFLDREAKNRGWKDWIDAYHNEAKVGF